MSRLRHLARNVSSGYLQVAANTVYTLLAIPLALHYLSTKAFGLWALVTTITGWLMLLDAGMTGASMRFLIDHKDRPQDGIYGSVFKTGSVVLAIQGAMIAALSSVVGLMPGLFDVPSDYVRPFQILLLGHGVVTGLSFCVRMYGSVLNAHQRHDIVNYIATAGFAVNVAVLWVGFHFGLGVYSLLAAYSASTLIAAMVYVIAAYRLNILPPAGAKGHFDRNIFKELFRFANELLLMSIGLQLINASQIVIVTRTLGLETAAVWSVAMKGYGLAQQFVWRLWDYSANAISEMFVRQERERLRRRFQELVMLTASASVVAGIIVGACNESLLAVWTRHRISWSSVNDLLLPIVFVVTSVTRLNVGLISSTKKIRSMRYVYFIEGIVFVAAGFLLAPRFGIPAVLICATVTNLACTGVYGTCRTAEEFGLRRSEVMSWLFPAACLGAILAPIAFGIWWLSRALPDLPRLIVNFSAVAPLGAVLIWKIGITRSLQMEIGAKLTSVLKRLPLLRLNRPHTGA